ncbi:hypothetical protein PM082_010122 [Marasmius tenuissimus]|nr:hypothetical protein PM082_010122 [Marasmius tenuissimus]
MLKDKLDMDGKVLDLVDTMNELYGCTTVKEDPLHNYQVLFDAMIEQSINCFLFISNYDSENYPKHMLEESLQHLKRRFSDEQLRVNTSTTLQVKDLVVALHELIEDVGQEVKLQALKMTILKPRYHCLPGTRVSTLTEIFKRDFGGNEPLLWLSGLAGTGKSAIMGSLSDCLIQMGCSSCLAAFIHFDRFDFRSPSEFMKALTYQLAKFDPRLGEDIVGVIKRRPHVINLTELSDQLQSLIIQPLQQHKPRLLTEGPIVVLIDGLDECMEGVSGSEEFRQLLQLFSNSGTFQLFPFLWFILASRPLEPIRTALTGAGQDHIHHIRLDMLSNSARNNIRHYFTMKFEPLFRNNSNFEILCQQENTISELTELSGGLFIWAVTIFQFLEGHPTHHCLRSALQMKPDDSALSTLSSLYHS